jgi:deazaflavin-dependent oxidoreductase (nitroreductase family)
LNERSFATTKRSTGVGSLLGNANAKSENDSMTESAFLKPTTIERIFNGTFGLIVRFGGGLKHNYELEVRGRKSGKVFRTPVNLLEFKGKRFLIGTRGETQWARNARAAGEIALRKGSQRTAFKLRELGEPEKLEVVKEFLDRFAKTVQRYYVAKPGAPAAEFGQDAAKMPVFELITS